VASGKNPSWINDKTQERIPMLGESVWIYQVDSMGLITTSAAIICHVHLDGKTINVNCLNEDGEARPCRHVHYKGHETAELIGWDFPKRQRPEFVK
jgi:hypothetical protein